MGTSHATSELVCEVPIYHALSTAFLDNLEAQLRPSQPPARSSEEEGHASAEQKHPRGSAESGARRSSALGHPGRTPDTDRN